jgi:hypothetical protein
MVASPFWDIRADLGHIKADTIILEAQFDFAQNTTMPDAALATVAAAKYLYGKKEARIVMDSFKDREII